MRQTEQGEGPHGPTRLGEVRLVPVVLWGRAGDDRSQNLPGRGSLLPSCAALGLHPTPVLCVRRLGPG